MKITAIIPARSGSKRLRNKNIYPVWGKPMLFWAIKACKESQHMIEPWVTTDSEEIARIARDCGAAVVMRDISTSDDSAYKQTAIRDAASKIDAAVGKSDIYISLQANSPQIKSEHLDFAIDVLLKNNKSEIISCNDNMMQNGAFRIFKGDYVYQRDLSTNCGFVIINLEDVHTVEDVDGLENEKD